VIVRGLLDDDVVDAIERECAAAARRLVAGELPARYGTTDLTDDRAGRADQAGRDGTPDPGGPDAALFANYVTHITELAPTTAAAADHPVLVQLMRGWLGAGAWLGDERFGVVYQDARPGPDSGYSRIGWHSDWQSGPHRRVWPSVAFTVHVDETSPANGFLRVVPGSHLWATPPPYDNVNGATVPDGSAPWGGHGATPPPFPMPLGFEKIPGEVAVYADRGDILFHDGYLWHSAARATVDGSIRRHVRGSWFGGERPVDDSDDIFVKNAAR
jgi:hypothetical protein